MKTLKMVHIKKSNKRWGSTGKQASSSSFCPLGLGLGGGGPGRDQNWAGREPILPSVSVCSAFFLISHGRG